MIDFYPIDRGEVLKYLHCKSEDEATKALIDKAEVEIRKTVEPRFTYRVFDIQKADDNEITLSGTPLKLLGSDIKKHLEGCNKIILMGATLGESADRLLRVTQIKDMAEAVVLDCTLSVYIESFCDFKEAQLRKIAAEKGDFLTSRFSPGYGNFPLDTQPEILSVLDAQKKIGLTLTPAKLLVPTKSVTAVIGISDHAVSGTLAGCKNCVLKGKCEFIKSGTTCFKK